MSNEKIFLATNDLHIGHMRTTPQQAFRDLYERFERIRKTILQDALRAQSKQRPYYRQGRW